MENYRLWYRLNRHNSYLIWCSDTSDESDGKKPDVFFVDESFIPSFESLLSLENYAKNKKIALVDEKPILHNLDQVKEWLDSQSEKISCENILAAWNLFDDISLTFKTESVLYGEISKKSQRKRNLRKNILW